MGLMIELTDSLVRGLVRVEDFPPDDYHYEASFYRYSGHERKLVFTLGDRLEVVLSRVNHERKLLDFRIVAGPLAQNG